MDFILTGLGKKLISAGLLDPKPLRMLVAVVDNTHFHDDLQSLLSDVLYIGETFVTPLDNGGEMVFSVPVDVGDFWISGLLCLTPGKQVVGFQSLPRVYKSKSAQAYIFRTKLKIERGECANERTLEKPESASYSDMCNNKVISEELKNIQEAFDLSSANLSHAIQQSDKEANLLAEKSVLDSSKLLNQTWGSELLADAVMTLFQLRSPLNSQAETANNDLLKLKLIELNQALKWKEVGSEICPIGVILAWPQEPPSGWALCHGQSFQKSKYPSLAQILPSGKLPDLRGMVIKGASELRAPLSYENDEVKSHNHQVHVSPARLTARLKSAGEHQHNVPDWGYTRYNQSSDGHFSYSRKLIVRFEVHFSSMNGQHSHTIHVGHHTHDLTLFDLEPSENRVKSLGFHYAIRMA